MFNAALRSPTLAAPLADPLLAAGRGGRYLGAAAPGGGLSGLLQAAQAAQRAQWAQWAPQAVPAGLAPLLSMLALSGWLMLWVGRLALPAGAIAVLGLAIWAVPVSMLRALSAVPDWWQSPWPAWPAQAQAASPLWLLPSAVLLLALPVASRCSRRAWQAAQAPHRAWLYPLWVLLTGLGMLWLTDYSARAAVQHRHLASHQFQALMGACAVLSLLAGLQPSLMPQLARLLARVNGNAPPASPPAGPGRAAAAIALWRRAWPRADFFGLLLVWVLLVFLLLGRHAAQSAARAEALRAVCYLLGAWLAYR